MTFAPPDSGKPPTRRIVSPASVSILMTRAPRSASRVAANGPANISPKSSTVMPASGCPVAPSCGGAATGDGAVAGDGVAVGAAAGMGAAGWPRRGAGASSRSGRPSSWTRAEGCTTGPSSGSVTVTRRPSWTSWGWASASEPRRNGSAEMSPFAAKTSSHSARVRCPTRSIISSHSSVRSSCVGRAGMPAHFGSVNTSARPNSRINATNSRGSTCANCSQVPSFVGAVSSGYTSGPWISPAALNALTTVNASGQRMPTISV